ncbi:ODF3A protein, partial [Nothoprocta pentlandii]|nr:ODF3A protein [Nothoprocta pentlandii]
MYRAWVGTWKPHRPRGPVMAQFTGPGPKYSIPGTTGYLKHDPTKRQAPAYSFSGAKPPVKDGCSPGPCYYVKPSMTKTGKYVAPGYVMSGRPKVTVEVTPGPGDYFLEKSKKHIYKCAPAHSMSFRHNMASVEITPGPGDYTIPRVMGPNTAYTTASPCYSMKWRTKFGLFEEDLYKTPGPAAYQKTELDVYKTRAPKYTMRSHNKPIGDKTEKPGPADYYIGKVTLTKPEAPAISFGIRHSKYTAPLILDT